MKTNCTADPNNKVKQPSSYAHVYLCTSYKYLVCERKRYLRPSASYHSMSAALYCLDRLINKYWPGTKSHKEQFSYLEFDTDNYLHLWYSFMTKACSRRINRHPDMVSVIVFIRDMVVTNPNDKKVLEKETTKKCCTKKPGNSITAAEEKLFWVECLLEKLETARWCAKTAIDYEKIRNHTENTQIAAAYEIINNIMIDICYDHNLDMKRYHIHTISGINRFGDKPGAECVKILNDILNEVQNLKIMIGDEQADKWIYPGRQEDILKLVNKLTPIYYK